MGVKFWFFLRVAEGNFRPLPLRTVEDFYHGKTTLPAQDGAVRVVEMTVQLENRHPVDVLRIIYPKYRVRRDGRISEADKMKEIDLVGPILGIPAFGSEPLPSNVLDARPRLARRRSDRLHRWAPTVRDDRMLKAVVNNRAGHELM